MMKSKKIFIGIAIISFCLSLTFSLVSLFNKTDAKSPSYFELRYELNKETSLDKKVKKESEESKISNVDDVVSFGSVKTDDVYTVSLVLSTDDGDEQTIDEDITLKFDYSMTLTNNNISLNFTDLSFTNTLDLFKKVNSKEEEAKELIDVIPLVNKLNGYELFRTNTLYIGGEKIEESSANVLDWKIIETLTSENNYSAELDDGIYCVSFLIRFYDKNVRAIMVEVLTDGTNANDYIYSDGKYFATMANHYTPVKYNNDGEYYVSTDGLSGNVFLEDNDDVRAANMFEIKPDGDKHCSSEYTLSVNRTLYQDYIWRSDISFYRNEDVNHIETSFIYWYDTNWAYDHTSYWKSDDRFWFDIIHYNVISYSIKDVTSDEYLYENKRENILYQLNPGRYQLEVLFRGYRKESGEGYTFVGASYAQIEFDVLPSTDYWRKDIYAQDEYNFIEFQNKTIDKVYVDTDNIYPTDEEQPQYVTNLSISTNNNYFTLYAEEIINLEKQNTEIAKFLYNYQLIYTAGRVTGIKINYSFVDEFISKGFNIYPVVYKVGYEEESIQLCDLLAYGTVQKQGDKYISNIDLGDGLDNGLYNLAFIFTCKAKVLDSDETIDVIIDLSIEASLNSSSGLCTCNNDKTQMYLFQNYRSVDNWLNQIEVTNQEYSDYGYQIKLGYKNKDNEFVNGYEYQKFDPSYLTYWFNIDNTCKDYYKGQTKELKLFNNVFTNFENEDTVWDDHDGASLDIGADGKSPAYYYNIYKKYGDGSFSLVYAQYTRQRYFNNLNAGSYRLEVLFQAEDLYYEEDNVGKFKHYDSTFAVCDFEVFEYQVTDEEGNIRKDCDILVTEMDTMDPSEIDDKYFPKQSEVITVVTSTYNLQHKTTYLYDFIEFYNKYSQLNEEDSINMYTALKEKYDEVLELYNAAFDSYYVAYREYYKIQTYFENYFAYNTSRITYYTNKLTQYNSDSYFLLKLKQLIVNSDGNDCTFEESKYLGKAYSDYEAYYDAYDEYIVLAGTYGLNLVNRNVSMSKYNDFKGFIESVLNSYSTGTIYDVNNLYNSSVVTRIIKPVEPAMPIEPVNFDLDYTGEERLPRIGLSMSLKYDNAISEYTLSQGIVGRYYSNVKVTLYNQGAIKSNYQKLYPENNNTNNNHTKTLETYDKNSSIDTKPYYYENYYAYKILTTDDKDVMTNCIDVGEYNFKLVFEGNFKGTVSGFKFNIKPIDVEITKSDLEDITREYSGIKHNVEKTLSIIRSLDKLTYTVFYNYDFDIKWERFNSTSETICVDLAYDIYKDEVKDENKLTGDKKEVKNVGTYIVRYYISDNSNGKKNFVFYYDDVTPSNVNLEKQYFDVTIVVGPSTLKLADDIGIHMKNGDDVAAVINSTSGLYATQGLVGNATLQDIVEIGAEKIAISYNEETGYDYLDANTNIVFAGKRYQIVIPISLKDKINYKLSSDQIITIGETTYIVFDFEISKEVVEIQYEDNITLTSIYDGKSHANAFDNKAYFMGFDLDSILDGENVNYKVNKNNIKYKKNYLEIFTAEDVIGIGEYEFNAKIDDVNSEWYILPTNSLLDKTYVITPKAVEINAAEFIYPNEENNLVYGDDFDDTIGYNVKVTGICNEDGYVIVSTEDDELGLFEIVGAKVIRKSVLAELFNGYMYYSEVDEDLLGEGKYQVELTIRCRSVNYNLQNTKVIINDLTVVKKDVEITWADNEYTFNGEEQWIEASFFGIYGGRFYLTNIENDDDIICIKVTKNNEETEFKYAGTYDVEVVLPKDLDCKYNIISNQSSSYTIEKYVLENPEDYISIPDVQFTGSKVTPVAELLIEDDIKVVLDDFVLTSENKDLNDSAEASISVNPDSSITFESFTKNFKLIPRTVTVDNIDYEFDECIFDGRSQYPDYTLTVLDNTITDKDINTVTYKSNIDAGTAKLEVVFKGNYTGTVELPFTIKKATLDTSSLEFTGDEHVYDGTVYTTHLTGVEEFEQQYKDDALINYKYTCGVQESFNNPIEFIEVGTYKVTLTIIPSKNYNDITPMEAVVTIKPTQLKPKDEEQSTDPEEERTSDVQVEYDKGFDPTTELVVKIQEKDDGYIKDTNLVKDLSKELKKTERATRVYDVKLLKIDNEGQIVEIQPSDLEENAELTVKILIPENVRGKSFKLLHIHSVEDITEILLGEAPAVGEYIIEGNYVVTKINKLSEFVFVIDVECPYHWIMIGLLILFFLFAMVCLFTKKISKLVELIVAAVFVLASLVLGLIGAITYGCAGCIVFMIVNTLFAVFALYILDKDDVDDYINKIISKHTLQKENV